MKRIRKAVWKEKTRDLSTDERGIPLREKYRLICDMKESEGILEFKLVLGNSIHNL